MSTQNDSRQILAATMRRCLPPMGYVLVFSLAINLLFLTSSLYMMQVFDRVMSSKSMDTLLFLTAIALFALLVLSTLEMVRSYVMVRVGSWMDAKLSNTAFDRVIGATLDGKNYNVQSLRDIQSLKGVVGGSGLFPLFDAPWAPIYLLVLYMLHPVLGHVALAGAVILFMFAVINEVATKQPLGLAGNATSQAMLVTETAQRNAQAIEAMGMVGAMKQRWLASNQNARLLQQNASDRASIVLSASKFFRQSLQIAIFAAGAMLALQQEISAGAMIAASMLMGRALAPVEQAIGTWKQILSARQAYARLQTFFGHGERRDDAMQLPVPAGHLHVDNVSFAIGEPPRPLLKRIDFQLAPGEVLALIGHSAAGKSTLAKLMSGIHKPNAGTVRLDGADIFQWRRDDIGNHLGYLPQDVELFPGTVAENIARMEQPDAEAVTKAAQLAAAHDLILTLPKGYDSEVGNNGINLSGGQRQRIALARVLYRMPKCVILDEPNSNLDNDGEEALAAAVKAMKDYGAAVVIISHRPSVLRLVDKIAYMKDGVIELFGTPDAVLAKLRGSAPAEAKAIDAANAQHAAEANPQPEATGQADAENKQTAAEEKAKADGKLVDLSQRRRKRRSKRNVLSAIPGKAARDKAALLAQSA